MRLAQHEKMFKANRGNKMYYQESKKENFLNDWSSKELRSCTIFQIGNNS